MREEQRIKNQISTSTMAVVALMTAVVCVLAPFSIPIGPVPLSFTMLALYLAVMILGGKKSTVVCLMYLLIGFVGFPVFSGFSGGPAKLFGPTGGYFIGYLLLTIIAGWFVDKYTRKRGMCALGLVLGTLGCYLVGTLWLAFQMKLNLKAAFLMGVVPFLFGDIVKIGIAVWIGSEIREKIRKAG